MLLLEIANGDLKISLKINQPIMMSKNLNISNKITV
jgi:hypothetical protein